MIDVHMSGWYCLYVGCVGWTHHVDVKSETCLCAVGLIAVVTRQWRLDVIFKFTAVSQGFPANSTCLSVTRTGIAKLNFYRALIR